MGGLAEEEGDPDHPRRVTQLILMIMRMDWKLNLILEELDIDYGEAPY